MSIPNIGYTSLPLNQFEKPASSSMCLVRSEHLSAFTPKSWFHARKDLFKAMADKLERDIEMTLGMAEKGANVTMNTALQLVIKQRTEEFLLTLDQALMATRRGNRSSGEIKEDQGEEAEANIQSRTRVAESREGRTSRSRDAQEAKF